MNLKSQVVILLSFLVLGFLSAGCDDSVFNGGVVCTQIGCTDGVTIKISEERPDSLLLTIYLNDDTEAFATTHCTNPNHPCVLGVEEETPEKVTVKAGWENGEFNKTFTPEYKDFQPNGPKCPPICSIALIEIDLSGE